MTGNNERADVSNEVAAQLDLIESMIREGRKSTSYWGWNFVLWGVAYLVAMAWANVLTNSRSALWAWPVSMTVAGVSTFLIARWRNQGNPETTQSRAVMAAWMAVGFAIIVFASSSVIANRLLDGHTFLATIETLLGVAQLSSGILLRWRLQIFVGLGWWTASLFTTFTHSDKGLLIPFVVGTLLLNIGFGAYLMYCEARDKARLRSGQVVHA